jgi:hypothetical protein
MRESNSDPSYLILIPTPCSVKPIGMVSLRGLCPRLFNLFAPRLSTRGWIYSKCRMISRDTNSLLKRHDLTLSKGKLTESAQPN